MICYVLAMGKQHLVPHVVVGYGINMFWPGLFITSPDHLVTLYCKYFRGELYQRKASISVATRGHQARSAVTRLVLQVTAFINSPASSPT